MKIRQKVAMLLASAMVLTAVPAVTMAKSDFGLVSGIQVNEKDAVVTNSLKVEMKDATSNPFVFFVNLANAEFNAAVGPTTITPNGTPEGSGSVSYQHAKDSKEMKVTVNATSNYKATFELPLVAKLKGGDATVAVDGAGSVVADMGPVVFAQTSDKKATVTVGDAEPIYADAVTVATIKIEEPIAAKLAGKDIEFTSRHADYDIVSATVSYEKGFSGSAVTITNTNSDKGVFKLDSSYIPTSNGASGRLIVKLVMDTTEKNPATGDLNVKVSGDNVTSTIVKVATVVDYGTIIEMKDKKVVEVNEGKKKEITFTVKEAVADTFVANRDFDVTFDKAFLSNIKKATLGQLDLGTIKVKSDTDTTVTNADITNLLKDKDDFVYGFTLRVPAGSLSNTKIDKIEFSDMEVYVPLGTEGDVTVKVEGRSLGYDASTVAIDAKKVVDITTETFTAKVGLKEQTGGKIVIKEQDKAVLAQGEYILIKLENESGMKLDGKGTVEVTDGDMIIDDIDVNNGTLYIKVKRESTVASTITIKDVKLKLDRTVPQGTYKIEIAGRALAPDWTTVTAKGDKEWTGITKPLAVKNFVNVATANTEDLTTNNGLRKGTASFVIDSDKFIVNGKEITMDAKAYLDPAGRTMVPVRFVANALGIDDANIFYAQKTATIVAGGKTISVTLGDKVAKINGVAAKVMDVAPTMANDRVYVPVGELANLLSVKATWDGATQTATFTVE